MRFVRFILLITLSLLLSGACTSMLDEDNKVKITTDYIYSTPEGLSRAAAALYALDRSLVLQGEGDLYAHLMFDGCTDIVLFRTGSAVQLNKLTYTPSNNMISIYWSNRYNIIGKTNEIISAAESMGLDDEKTKQAWAEAKLYRARCYFDLYRRYGRLYLNIAPTTTDNLVQTFTPAKTEDVFKLIDEDLDDAITVLPWATTDIGRQTKAVAKHVRAQVALWEKDWDTAIACVDEIFSRPEYGMMDKAIECFQGADLTSKEVLLVLPFSGNTGGGNVLYNGSIVGHRMAMIGNSMYWCVNGLGYILDYGGTAWGRFYPNTYLLSLYDQAKDARYQELFRHKWYFPDGSEVVPATKAEYLKSLHPQTMKYFDKWTNTAEVTRMSSYKDIVVYRLAETALIGAEAYLQKEGGSSAKAIEYYNKTWERAGNAHFSGPLTIDLIVDEYAREMCFEGTRWHLLNRLGILADRVKLHYGDSTAEDPWLAANQIDARNAFVSPKHNFWPIPQSEIDNMGKDNFPQNEGWD